MGNCLILPIELSFSKLREIMSGGTINIVKYCPYCQHCVIKHIALGRVDRHSGENAVYFRTTVRHSDRELDET
jgi:hypothetical protein